MRNLCVIEATATARPFLGGNAIVPRRYFDSERWLVAAWNLVNSNGELGKTIATFQADRDRPAPSVWINVWPWKRMFGTVAVDEDLTCGFSTIMYALPREGTGEYRHVNSGT
jgi:hypothetical protein